MCGRDAFAAVTENIRALKEAGVDVSLNLSITPWNRQDLQKIYAISRELELPIRASSYMYPSARQNAALRHDAFPGNTAPSDGLRSRMGCPAPGDSGNPNAEGMRPVSPTGALRSLCGGVCYENGRL